MIWYHYSRKPISALYNVKQVAPHMKPRGLWYAAGDSWKVSSADWNYANAFDYRYEVIVSPEARILAINTHEEAEDLARRIGVWNGVDQSFIRMRWMDAAPDYDDLHLGIEYEPSNCRSIAQWHYAFDVIGGCVWNTDAVELIDCKTGKAVPHGGLNPRSSKPEIDLSKFNFRCAGLFVPADGSASQAVEMGSMSIDADSSVIKFIR